MWTFNLQLFGASNNADSQNTAAQQQINQAYQKAMQAFMQWQQANPFPLMNATPPQAGPQFNGSSAGSGGGHQFGGAQGALMDTLAQAGKKKKGS